MKAARTLCLGCMIVVLLVASVVAAKPGERRMRGQVDRLTRLGYKQHIANRLVRAYPRIAQEILTLAAQDRRLPRLGGDRWSFYYHGERAYEPVTLYRGVDAEQLIPDKTWSYRGHRGLARTFLSDRMGYPLMRAIWSYSGGYAKEGRTRGLMVEVQVPKYLVFGDYNPKFYRNSSNTAVLGIGHPVLLQDMVPNLMPFIDRVGTIPFNREAERAADRTDPGIISWRSAADSVQLVAGGDTASQGAVPANIRRPARWIMTRQPKDYIKAISAPGVTVSLPDYTPAAR
jgi:hypothetical protein